MHWVIDWAVHQTVVWPQSDVLLLKFTRGSIFTKILPFFCTKEFQRTVEFSENFDPYSPDDYLYPWQQGKRVPGWQVDVTDSGRFEIGDGLIFIADEYADDSHLRIHKNIPQFFCTNKTLIVRFTAKFSHINRSAVSRPRISGLCFQLSNGSIVSREIHNFNVHAFCVKHPVLMKLPSILGTPSICATGDCSSTFEPPIPEYAIGPDKPKLYSFSLRPDNSYTITINNRLVYDSLLPQLTRLRGQMPPKQMPNSCQHVSFLTLSLGGTSVRLNDIVISTTDWIIWISLILNKAYEIMTRLRFPFFFLN